MTKQAVLYARVSTDEQAEKGYSLPTQLDALRKYAAEHGFTVADEIQDDYSGAKLNRPGLDRLRAMVERGEAGAVICYTVDRLTRNPGHAWELAETWHRAGVELHFCNRGQSEDTPEGTMTYGFESLFAYYYRAKTIESTRRGIMAKAKAGKWVGTSRAPYGYRREGKGDTVRLVIDPAESTIVKRIYALYVGQRGQPPMPLKRIAATLTIEGVKPPERNNSAIGWHNKTVRDILTRAAYLGKFDYAGQAINLPELAILDGATWAAAQKRRDKNKALGRRNQKREYLLSGHFKCVCGRMMSGHTWHAYSPSPTANYECAARLSSGHLTTCQQKSLPAPLAEALVWNKLRANLDPERIEQAVTDERDRREAEMGADRARLDLLADGITRGERKVKRLAADYAAALGESDDDDEDNPHANALNDQLKMAGSQLKALMTERDKLGAELSAREITPEDIAEIKQAAEELSADIDNADFAGKRFILDRLDVQVKIKPNAREFEMSYLLEKGPVTIPIEYSCRPVA